MAETLETTIQSVEHDMANGWFTVITADGKFSTKIREKADEALGLRGKKVALEYTEQIKHKDGRQYRNRYYERASEAFAGDGGGFTETNSRRTPMEDAWRMSLGAGVKAAVDTLPMLPPEQRTFEAQKQIALAWGRFIFLTEPPNVADMLQQPPASWNPPAPVPVSHGAYSEPNMESPPPHSDDDIPF